MAEAEGIESAFTDPDERGARFESGTDLETRKVSVVAHGPTGRPYPCHAVGISPRQAIDVPLGTAEWLA